MSRFVRGDIVVVPFPFSTGTDYKRRPALVIAAVPFGADHDYFLCCVSLTRETNEPNLIEFNREDDMEPGATYGRSGGIGNGYIRPTTLFTIDGAQVNQSLGRLLDHKMEDVLTVIRRLIG